MAADRPTKDFVQEGNCNVSPIQSRHWFAARDAMQGIAIAMTAGAKKAHFDATIGIHPTAAEEFVGMRSPVRTVSGEGPSAFVVDS